MVMVHLREVARAGSSVVLLALGAVGCSQSVTIPAPSHQEILPPPPQAPTPPSAPQAPALPSAPQAPALPSAPQAPAVQAPTAPTLPSAPTLPTAPTAQAPAPPALPSAQAPAPPALTPGYQQPVPPPPGQRPPTAVPAPGPRPRTPPTPSGPPLPPHSPRTGLVITITQTSVERGSEVKVYVTPARTPLIVRFNKRVLPFRMDASGKVLTVTIPDDATSGFFEVEWKRKRYRSLYVTVE